MKKNIDIMKINAFCYGCDNRYRTLSILIKYDSRVYKKVIRKRKSDVDASLEAILFALKKIKKMLKKNKAIIYTSYRIMDEVVENMTIDNVEFRFIRDCDNPARKLINGA